MAELRLKRTRQCAKCPWRKDVDPRSIPDGYDVAKHRALADTIADPEDPLSSVRAALAGGGLKVMACHETASAMCVGWVHNQLGAGNNLALRLRLRGCRDVARLRLVGPQHARFEDTLPRD